MSETMKTVDICPTAAKGLREAADWLDRRWNDVLWI